MCIDLTRYQKLFKREKTYTWLKGGEDVESLRREGLIATTMIEGAGAKIKKSTKGGFLE